MKLFHSLMMLAFAGFVSFSAAAQERGTKDEAKALADSAVEYVKKVGPDQAFKDFAADKAKWTKKDMYVIVLDMKANMIFHGVNEKLMGKPMWEMKDQNGKLFNQDMVKTAQTTGSGWIEYDWVHPVTKKIEAKTTYIRKMSNYDGFVGVGVYR